MAISITAKNTVISPNFLVWKFFGKAQFPHRVGRIVQNYAETVPFIKFPHQEKKVKLRYFLQCINFFINVWQNSKRSHKISNPPPPNSVLHCADFATWHLPNTKLIQRGGDQYITFLHFATFFGKNYLKIEKRMGGSIFFQFLLSWV